MIRIRLELWKCWCITRHMLVSRLTGLDFGEIDFIRTNFHLNLNIKITMIDRNLKITEKNDPCEPLLEKFYRIKKNPSKSKVELLRKQTFSTPTIPPPPPRGGGGKWV